MKILQLIALANLLVALPASAQLPDPHTHRYDFDTLFLRLGYAEKSEFYGASEFESMELLTYTDAHDSSGYEELNAFLRLYPKPYHWTGTSPSVATTMKNRMDAVIDRAPSLPNDITLFRGFTLSWHQNLSFAVGEEFTDKAYISTTLAPIIAKRFARGAGFNSPETSDRHAMLTLYFDQSHEKGLLIKGEGREQEILLKHGRHFRVMARNIVGNWDYYLVQICGLTTACNPGIRDSSILSTWQTTRLP